MNIAVYFQMEILSLSSRKLKEKKKDLSRLQRSLANNDNIRVVTRYHILLPKGETHAFHPTHGPASYAQCVHPKLKEKIYELVADGTTDVCEVKRALKYHVSNVLCPDLKPDHTDRSYFPTATDIRNHIYNAQHGCQLSSLDQENLKLKIENTKPKITVSLQAIQGNRHG